MPADFGRILDAGHFRAIGDLKKKHEYLTKVPRRGHSQSLYYPGVTPTPIQRFSRNTDMVRRVESSRKGDHQVRLHPVRRRR